MVGAPTSTRQAPRPTPGRGACQFLARSGHEPRPQTFAIIAGNKPNLRERARHEPQQRQGTEAAPQKRHWKPTGPRGPSTAGPGLSSATGGRRESDGPLFLWGWQVFLSGAREAIPSSPNASLPNRKRGPGRGRTGITGGPRRIASPWGGGNTMTHRAGRAGRGYPLGSPRGLEAAGSSTRAAFPHRGQALGEDEKRASTAILGPRRATCSRRPLVALGRRRA